MEINKFISAAIIFVIALALIFLFVLPKYEESVSLQDTLVKKQIDYNNKYVYYAKILDAAKMIEENKDSLEKIHSALPSEVSLAPLIYFLQKKGGDAGLHVISVDFSQFSPTSSVDQIKNITLNIKVSGSYEGLKSFLSSLETSARLFEVDSISFASAAVAQDVKLGQNPLRTYDFNLVVRTHTY
jgi:Tfp pilus assembly protein PilO